MTREKSKALLSSMLLQEIYFLRTIEELMSCKCLDSAMELWAGRYQLRFQYSKKDRYQQSPIEICLGSICLPYGLEYYGGYIRVVPDLQLENALQKVLGSCFSMRGSVFISFDNPNYLFEAHGEYSVSCKDIAATLGRICTTIASVENKQSVHQFLARLVYLDAVGSVDFTNIDHAGLQVLISSMNAFWTSVEGKNDQFLQDALKYPLKNRFSRNELQSERRKVNLAELRGSINWLKKSNRYAGMMVIGMASETFYSSISVFDHFYRSIFNAVSVPNNQPINNLGQMLTAEGFCYGMDIQATLKSSIVYLGDKTDSNNIAGIRTQQQLIERLCTSLELRALVQLAASILKLHQLSKAVKPTGKVGRFKVELLCFCAVLWERVLLFAYEEGIDLVTLRNDLFLSFYKKLEMISSPEEIITFDKEIGSNELMINDTVNIAMIKSAVDSGLVCTHEFVTKCALLWSLLSKPSNNVVIISGEAAVGKTAVRNTVMSALRLVGTQCDAFFSESWPLQCRRAAFTILRKLRKYHAAMKEAQAKTNVHFTIENDNDKEQEQQQQMQNHEQANLYVTSSSPKAGNNSKNSNKSSYSPGGNYATTTTAAAIITTTTTATNSTEDSANLLITEEEADAAADEHRRSFARKRSLVRNLTVKSNENQSAATTVASSSAAISASAAVVAAAQAYKVKRNHPLFRSAHRRVVKVSTIHHASLSAAQFLGYFDINGRWLDGILVRQIRMIDEQQRKKSVDGSNSHTSTAAAAASVASLEQYYPTMHVIVLNGPIGYYVEQIFSGPFYLSSATVAPHDSVSSNRRLILPSGELHMLPTDVKIIVETNDITHASPACFVHIPMLRVSTTGELCMKRLLTLWVRSLTHWLGDFPPWLDILDFIHDLFLKKKFVEDLLCDEYMTTNIPVVVVVSRISAFLRYLEDLLAQCHAMALVDATFIQPDDRDEDDERHIVSDDDDDSDSNGDSDGSGDDAENVATTTTPGKDKITNLIEKSQFNSGHRRNSVSFRGDGSRNSHHHHHHHRTTTDSDISSSGTMLKNKLTHKLGQQSTGNQTL